MANNDCNILLLWNLVQDYVSKENMTISLRYKNEIINLRWR